MKMSVCLRLKSFLKKNLVFSPGANHLVSGPIWEHLINQIDYVVPHK